MSKTRVEGFVLRVEHHVFGGCKCRVVQKTVGGGQGASALRGGGEMADMAAFVLGWGMTVAGASVGARGGVMYTISVVNGAVLSDGGGIFGGGAAGLEVAGSRCLLKNSFNGCAFCYRGHSLSNTRNLTFFFAHDSYCF